MKIQVLTSEYEYMGLPLGLVVDAEPELHKKFTPNAAFVYNGKVWHLDTHEYMVLENPTEQIDVLKPTKLDALTVQIGGGHYKGCKIQPIKSDGGSSSYYDFEVPQHYLDLIVETGIIKTEYLIDIIFANDFDFACTFKALVRAKGITDGAGKEGNTLDYELNKMNYYEGKIKEKYGWQNE